jgi:hypothetical protein
MLQVIFDKRTNKNKGTDSYEKVENPYGNVYSRGVHDGWAGIQSNNHHELDSKQTDSGTNDCTAGSNETSHFIAHATSSATTISSNTEKN